MNEKMKQVADVLITLRNESLSASINDVELLMKKYNLLFLGEKFNTIASTELIHLLRNMFKMDLTLKELNDMIPEISKFLKMEVTPKVFLQNLGSDVVDEYSIILH